MIFNKRPYPSQKMKVLLSIDYDIEGVGCKSMMIVSSKKWEKITKILKKLKKMEEKTEVKGEKKKRWYFEPYESNPPMELMGNCMYAKDILRDMHVEDDQEKVKAFKTLFGKKFDNCTSSAIESIFDSIEEFAENIKEIEKMEKMKKMEENDEEN